MINKFEELEAKNNPEDDSLGFRKVTFSKELYIEKDDFMEDAPKKYFRLSIGKEVRLLHAYYITCTHIEKDSSGVVKKIHCRYDSKTKGGWSEDGRKVKGTIHWVSAKHSINAKVKVYDKLFNKMNPYDGDEKNDFIKHLNQNSLKLINVKLESSMINSLKVNTINLLGKVILKWIKMQIKITSFQSNC